MRAEHFFVSLAVLVPNGLCFSDSSHLNSNTASITRRQGQSFESDLFPGSQPLLGTRHASQGLLRRAAGDPLPSDMLAPDNTSHLGDKAVRSPELSWPGSKALTTRLDTFETKTQLALKLLGKTSVLGLGVIGFYGLVGDCIELSEDPSVSSGFICVGGSISAAISTVTMYKEVQSFFIEYGKTIKSNAIAWGANYLYSAYVGGHIGWGPWLRTSAGSDPSPVKRGNGETIDRYDDAIFKRAESHLTSAFGVEIRHIGFWDGTMPGDWLPEMKREELELTPVFALSLRGQDVHFAYLGQDAEENGVFKFGHGPGPATPENKQRLKSRNIVPLYNDYYFANGGLDVIGQSDIDSSYNQQDIFPDMNSNQMDWTWVYDEIACYFGISATAHTAQMDAAGLWFQYYDSESRGTLSSGVISPFYGSTQSAIAWMRPQGGLDDNPTCTSTALLNNRGV